MDPKERVTSPDFEERILNILKKDIMSTSNLARQLGVRRDIVAGYLEALKNQGKVEFKRVGKAHVYLIREGKR